ncbi:hypothetical protein ABEG10_31470 [Burkholderia cenocepacia]|uniref:hypothetical protein n=1 Tax=Burkholderia cenocepacia TaxID=95486 RepID=UPI0020A1DC90|nr:hypothetical protein [Burkholderia cenocepacia]MCO8325509.1 hypothetical protein [Burkholderia cenocepacia]MCO8332579.1 hypothetical protein [Burkholderia cenocepacia]MCO8340079.1 hypothetical protein [Burkholderia cenocepacia]MCO8347365.1 hypothetical protein [Burkholderia cenocepacia]MCO8360431.1 hypothetical protein [Burkholderia cenocepacia]
MKRVALAAALTLFAAFNVPAIAGAPSGAPLIRVCVGDADTQLNLPWFLTDVLTAVDTHQSPSGLLHKMRNDF